MTNPTFGEKKEGVTYKTRYGVYAVIPDSNHEKIILVQAPNGAWFLPMKLLPIKKFKNL